MKEGRKASKTSSLSKVSEKSLGKFICRLIFKKKFFFHNLELTVIPSGERVQQKTERKSKESLKQSIKSEKLLTETATEEVADDIIEGGIIIPKEIPTYETAWNEYVNEKSCRYEEHLQLVKNMEENAKAIYQEYSRQVKAFQETAAFLQVSYWICSQLIATFLLI